jgi:GNAT superfamily N-acetyltransferase
MSEPSVPKHNFMELTSIASCTPEDFADLRELHKMSISHSGWHFYSLAEVAAKLKEIDEPEYTISLLSENVLLAKMHNTLVGTSSWRPSSEHPQTAEITQLYVNPLFANGGIATALIEQTEQVAYDSGFRWISALADFNSRAFYARLGYEGQGFKGCNPDRSIQYPLQIMTRHISSQYSTNADTKAHSEKLPVHNQVSST